MKNTTVLLLAALALALAGCSTDEPIISTPASQAKAGTVRQSDGSDANAGPSAVEETRDLANQRNNGFTMRGSGGNNDPTQSGSKQMQSMSPYGH